MTQTGTVKEKVKSIFSQTANLEVFQVKKSAGKILQH